MSIEEYVRLKPTALVVRPYAAKNTDVSTRDPLDGIEAGDGNGSDVKTNHNRREIEKGSIVEKIELDHVWNSRSPRILLIHY